MRQKLELFLPIWDPTFWAPILPHFVGALFEWGPLLKEGLPKKGPCFHERQKIELFPQNLTNRGPLFGASTLGPPTLFRFVGPLFDRGPPQNGTLFS
jgi:hypothetical protein